MGAIYNLCRGGQRPGRLSDQRIYEVITVPVVHFRAAGWPYVRNQVTTGVLVREERRQQERPFTTNDSN